MSEKSRVLKLEKIVLRYIINEFDEISKIWIENGFCLPFRFCDKIFRKLHKKYELSKYAHCFYYKYARLNTITIFGTEIKRSSLLSFLKNHQIETIKILGIHTEIFLDLFKYLNENHLKELKICRTKIVSYIFWDRVVLERVFDDYNFDNLIKLSLKHTYLNNQGFEYICEKFKKLHDLNISGTKVTDISPIENLQYLRIFKYNDIKAKGFRIDSTNLKKLQYLQEIFVLYRIDRQIPSFYTQINLLQDSQWDDLYYLSLFTGGQETEMILR